MPNPSEPRSRLWDYLALGTGAGVAGFGIYALNRYNNANKTSSGILNAAVAAIPSINPHSPPDELRQSILESKSSHKLFARKVATTNLYRGVGRTAIVDSSDYAHIGTRIAGDYGEEEILGDGKVIGSKLKIGRQAFDIVGFGRNPVTSEDYIKGLGKGVAGTSLSADTFLSGLSPVARQVLRKNVRGVYRGEVVNAASVLMTSGASSAPKILSYRDFLELGVKALRRNLGSSANERVNSFIRSRVGSAPGQYGSMAAAESELQNQLGSFLGSLVQTAKYNQGVALESETRVLDFAASGALGNKDLLGLIYNAGADTFLKGIKPENLGLLRTNRNQGLNNRGSHYEVVADYRAGPGGIPLPAIEGMMLQTEASRNLAKLGLHRGGLNPEAIASGWYAAGNRDFLNPLAYSAEDTRRVTEHFHAQMLGRTAARDIAKAKIKGIYTGMGTESLGTYYHRKSVIQHKLSKGQISAASEAGPFGIHARMVYDLNRNYENAGLTENAIQFGIVGQSNRNDVLKEATTTDVVGYFQETLNPGEELYETNAFIKAKVKDKIKGETAIYGVFGPSTTDAAGNTVRGKLLRYVRAGHDFHKSHVGLVKRKLSDGSIRVIGEMRLRESMMTTGSAQGVGLVSHATTIGQMESLLHSQLTSQGLGDVMGRGHISLLRQQDRFASNLLQYLYTDIEEKGLRGNGALRSFTKRAREVHSVLKRHGLANTEFSTDRVLEIDKASGAFSYIFDSLGQDQIEKLAADSRAVNKNPLEDVLRNLGRIQKKRGVNLRRYGIWDIDTLKVAEDIIKNPGLQRSAMTDRQKEVDDMLATYGENNMFKGISLRTHLYKKSQVSALVRGMGKAGQLGGRSGRISAGFIESIATLPGQEADKSVITSFFKEVLRGSRSAAVAPLFTAMGHTDTDVGTLLPRLNQIHDIQNPFTVEEILQKTGATREEAIAQLDAITARGGNMIDLAAIQDPSQTVLHYLTKKENTGRGFYFDMSQVGRVNITGTVENINDVRNSLNEVFLPAVGAISKMSQVSNNRDAILGGINKNTLEFLRHYMSAQGLSPGLVSKGVNTTLSRTYNELLTVIEMAGRGKEGFMNELAKGVRFSMSGTQGLIPSETIAKSFGGGAGENMMSKLSAGGSSVNKLGTVFTSMETFNETNPSRFIEKHGGDLLYHEGQVIGVRRFGFAESNPAINQAIARAPVQILAFNEAGERLIERNTGINTLKDMSAVMTGFAKHLYRDFDWDNFILHLMTSGTRGSLREYNKKLNAAIGNIWGASLTEDTSAAYSRFETGVKSFKEIGFTHALTPSEHFTVTQAQVVQKQMTGAANIAMSIRRGAIDDITKNLSTAEIAAMESDPGIQKMVQMTGRGAADLLKLSSEFTFAATEQLNINKGFADVVTGLIMGSGAGSRDRNAGLVRATEQMTQAVQLTALGGGNRTPVKAEIMKNIEGALRSFRNELSYVKKLGQDSSGMGTLTDPYYQGIEKDLSDANIGKAAEDVFGSISKATQQMSIGNSKNLTDAELISGSSKLVGEHLSRVHSYLSDPDKANNLFGRVAQELKSFTRSEGPGALLDMHGDTVNRTSNIVSRLWQEMLGVSTGLAADTLSDGSPVPTDYGSIPEQIAEKNRIQAAGGKAMQDGMKNNLEYDVVNGNRYRVVESFGQFARAGTDLIRSISTSLNDTGGKDMTAARNVFNEITGGPRGAANYLSGKKPWFIGGAAVVGAIGVAHVAGAMSGSDVEIEQAPLPPRLALDNSMMQSTPSYSSGGGGSNVYVAREMGRKDNVSADYSGNDPRAFALQHLNNSSGTIIQDNTRSFSRMDMNSTRRRQENSRF